MIMRLQHQRPDGEIDTYHLKAGRRYHIGRGSACEVRILDLKLSRKHCAVEFVDNAWHVIDLVSTNGCTLDGEQIVGAVPLQVGARIEAGQTALTVASTQGDESGSTESEASDAATIANVKQEELPEFGTARAGAEQQDSRNNAWEGEPGPAPTSIPDALTPNKAASPGPATTPTRQAQSTPAAPRSGDQRQTPAARPPTAVFRAEELAISEEQDGQSTRRETKGAAAATPDTGTDAAPAPQPSQPPTDSIPKADRAYFITVLGRRVGPLSHTAARELKSRELRGNLTTADLEGYPLA